MSATRRDLTKKAGARGVTGAPSLPRATRPHSAKHYDVCVIGAGVFGSWTALELARRGLRVALVDAYGPANSRASSGGESRIIRMGYGPDEIYTRWAMRSLDLWTLFCERVGQPLFHATGVLWLASAQDPFTGETLETLKRLGVRHERLTRAALEARYPQIDLGGVSWALYEPGSGILMARRAVQAVVDEAVRQGVDYLPNAVAPPQAGRRLESVAAGTTTIKAGSFVFACGPWLPKIFPVLLGERIFPTRQEIFYFGLPAGDDRFRPPALPVWMDLAEEMYGMPDLDGKGFKVAPDWHGPPFDPDADERVVTPKTLASARAFLERRFPSLKGAPVVASEVCQYENTSNGDFLIDRHPEQENVWMVGGGSGHGFKHGPALGEYVAARLTEGGPLEARFTLATKGTAQKRAVR